MTIQKPLSGKRILIVEDEYFIAGDLKRALTEADAIVVGPVGNLADGLALATDSAIDGAILDVNLDGARSYPIAERLAARSVPFLFVTGYDDWALPDDYRSAPRVAKPFSIASILAEMKRMVTGEIA